MRQGRLQDDTAKELAFDRPLHRILDHSVLNGRPGSKCAADDRDRLRA